MSANTWLSLVVVVFWLGLGIAIRASRSTTSIFPVIPLVPGVLWLVGVVVNHFASPWGTVVVGAIHCVLLFLMLFLLARWRKEKQ